MRISEVNGRINQLKKQQNRKNMKCKVASKVIAASMAVAMVITMAGCGSSGKKVEATKIDVTLTRSSSERITQILKQT